MSMIMKGRDSSGESLRAPGASSAPSGVALKLPSSSNFPRVDERLVQPETRAEVVRGRRVHAQPASPPHADRHFELDYVVRAHVRAGYIGSTDLLTRSADSSDFATDTSIRREGRDPATDSRYLEEVSFEVVAEQSLKDITERAEDLSRRGVRRVFAIFVKRGEVMEWQAAEGLWKPLDGESAINDPCLSGPLRVRALLDAAEADNAVAQALVAKGNPVITALRDESRREGRREGRREALERLFEKRLGRTLMDAERGAMAERLERLGEEQVSDAVLELSADALAAWLAEPR